VVQRFFWWAYPAPDAECAASRTLGAECASSRTLAGKGGAAISVSVFVSAARSGCSSRCQEVMVVWSSMTLVASINGSGKSC
jgi:hypothetical protein